MYAIVITSIIALSYILGKVIDYFQKKQDLEFKEKCLNKSLKKKYKTININ